MKPISYYRLVMAAAALLLFSCSEPDRQTVIVPTYTHEDTLADYRTAITSLLQSDATIGRQNKNDHTTIASEMRKLDMSACPRDFAVAYLDHIHTWEDAAEIQRVWNAFESKENIDKLTNEALWQKIFGSDRTVLDDATVVEQKLQIAQENASTRIKETFNEVERIAVSYAATLPPPVSTDKM